MSGDAVHQPTWPLLLKIDHMVKIEETLVKYPKDMFKQTFDVLKKWQSSGDIKTICMLMKAFKSVDKRGIKFLREKYR